MARCNVWMVVGLVAWASCVADSKEIGASGSTAGSSGSSGSSGSAEGSAGTSALTGESTAGTTAAEGTGTASSTAGSTGGGIAACSDAQSQPACVAADAASEDTDCSWLDTTIYAGGNGCTVVPDTGFEGECAQTGQSDSCGTLETASCPDGETVVFFRELGLEIGAIEIIAVPSGTCSEATAGFEPCVMIDDGQTVSYEPPECGCACPA